MGEIASSMSSATKWDVMKQTVKNFLPGLKASANLSSDDRLSVVFFGKNGSPQVEQLGPWDFDQAWMRTGAGIETNIFTSGGVIRMPEGMTPMGGGVQKGIEDFLRPTLLTNTSTVILFTDGMQNQEPYIVSPGITNSEDLANLCNEVRNLSGGGITTSLTTLGRNFRLFTIGVGANPSFRDLLRKVAEPNDFYAQADIATSTDLSQFFTMTIPAALKDCSPRILDYRVKQCKKGQSLSEKFTVNRFVNSLTINLKTHDFTIGDDFTLKKDGIIIPASVTYEADYLLLHVDFPIQQGFSSFDETGEWELNFDGGNGSYDLWAIVEDKNLKADLSTDNKSLFFPQQKIPVEIVINHNGTPVTGAIVKAALLKPGQDLGDLASETSVLTLGEELEPGLPIGQRKINALMRNSIFVEKLKKSGLVVDLTEIGGGKYSHVFNGNEVTGTYQVVVWYEGDLGNAGKCQGWESKCVLVDFGQADDIELNPTLVTTSLGSSDGVTLRKSVLTFTPTNKVGNKLGPGQTNRIKLNSTNHNWSTLIDNLDGSYQSVITYSGASPEVSIFVVDGEKPVFDNRLSSIQQKWGISAHVGITNPIKGLDSLYNPGYFVGADLSYRIKPNHLIALLGGYYHFSPNYDLWGASLSYKVTEKIAQSPFVGHVLLGVNAFLQPDDKINSGITVGVGLGYRPNNRYQINVEGRLQSLLTPAKSFATLGLSGHYFF
jgi:hypothetical protein